MPENLISSILTVPVGMRFLLNLLLLILLIRGLYFSRYRKRELFLSFFAVNSIIFFVSLVLNKVTLSTGAAFGLFAVFSMLRYRTEGLTAKDMTYLFLSISLGLLAAMSLQIMEFAAIGGVIVGLAVLIEARIFTKYEFNQEILYDNIQLIRPQCRDELIADLKQRTGLNITRIEIKHIDLIRDTTQLVIWYE